ncbi:PKD domain-containing protein [Candidatus Woesearchaeota archaeon]|nr:PKD domain-containing protein [Candidatus Woesearchaeota archaeon]
MQEIPYNMIDDDCNISTPDYLVLELVASKQTYSLGEISYITIDAHYGSDVYITVNTPINISYIYIFSNKSYPITQEFVFTNRSGTYSVESILYYTNYTLTKTLDFNVENSIQAQISVNQSVIYVNDRVTLSASASGGLGSLTYEWNLDDGTTSTQQTLGHTYTQPGTYNIVLIVKDLENNQVVVTKQLIVLRKYSVKITVVDNCTNHTLDDARVKLDDEKKYTENGAVEFIATNKTYSLRISKSEYEDYEDTITIDSDTYFTIGLKSENDLDVILLAPINNSEITSNAQFKFTATAYANCTLYTSEDNSWWTSQKSIAAAPGEEIGIGANDLSSALEKGVYYWKIECENIDSVFSETWRFKLTDIIVDSDNEEGDENPKIFTSAGEEMEENETFNVVQEVYNLLPDFDKFTPEQKRVAEILVLESKLKESKKKLDMANRDLFNLRYKTDSADIIETRDEILVRIETIKDETPISVRVEKNVQFIKYIEDDDAEELLKRYSDIKHLEASRSYIEQNKMLQKKITISTEAYNVELEYLSKRVEKFTIVSKSIELGSETNTLRLVEFLPKDIVQSADDIILLTGEALVIEKDPILELDLNTGVRELSYKLSNQINLDIIPKIKSLVVALDVDESQNRITGLAVLDKIGVSSKNKFIFVIEIVVIVVLLVVYMKNTKKLSNEDFEQVPSTFAEMQKILSDAEVLLTQNKVEEAAMKYEESKLMFNALEDRQKEQLYPEITELCNKTNYHYLLKLIEDIYSHLATKDHERVIELYNELNQEYQQLPENYKETIYPKCLELASILGDNEK